MERNVLDRLESGVPLRSVVVTGAAGFIGSRLVEVLLEQGVEVRGIDCFTDYYDRQIKERNIAPSSWPRRFSAL